MTTPHRWAVLALLGALARPALADVPPPAPQRAAVAPAPAAESGRSVATRALTLARGKVGEGRFVISIWHAPELSGDLLGDDGNVRVGVQLPRRAAECQARRVACWVVLYLPGFDGTPEEFHEQLNPALDALDARPDGAPMVVLVPDGRTKLGGGWYVDSPTSGRWETFLTQALLPAAIDTFAPGTPASRVLVVGHSMGGFGALHLFAAHPKGFGGAAALNPAARIPQIAAGTLAMLEPHDTVPDLAARLQQTDTRHFYERILLSLASAFFPDPKAPHGVGALFDPAKHPWKPSPAAQAALARADVAPQLSRLPPGRTLIFAGKNDRLIPLEQLEPLRSKRVELVVTDGDHLNHRAQDLKTALERLAR